MEKYSKTAKELFQKSIAAVTGILPGTTVPLGGTALAADGGQTPAGHLAAVVNRVFRYCAGESVSVLHENGGDDKGGDIYEMLLRAAERAKGLFCSFYASGENRKRAEEALSVLRDPGAAAETKAETISRIWAPETAMPDEKTLQRWKLTGVQPNPHPIQPTEVVLQLNALYTLPDNVDGDGSAVPAAYVKEARRVLQNPGKKVADYDHPVHLYEEDGNHELINCLKELDNDLAFEKKQGVLPEMHKMPVLLSVSVTHENLDEICGN